MLPRSGTEKRALASANAQDIRGWERSKKRLPLGAFNNNSESPGRSISIILREKEKIERGCGACDLRVQFAFRAALPVDRFLPGYLVFQAHVTPQVGSTTESGVADDAGSLVAMHFEVLGQRGKVPVNVSAESARKTPRALHHHLTSCIANVLPIASHPPCNTLTQPRDPPVPHHQLSTGSQSVRGGGRSQMEERAGRETVVILGGGRGDTVVTR